MKLHCRVVAVAMVVVLLVFLAAAGGSAAVGIFNWYASTSGGGAEIHYYLNLAGDSGNIRICPDQSDSPGPPIRTINLTPSDLTPGPHVVTWDGKDDAGSMTATGTYFARIYVHAAPVPPPADPNDPNQMLPNRKVIAGGTALYGVAVDVDPRNNNQEDPAKSTYGLVYVANPVYNRIEVYYPDGAPKSWWPTGWGSLWEITGVALSSDGRVFTACKTSTGSAVYNFAPDGTDVLGGNQCAPAIGAGAAWGRIADGDCRFQTLHSGRIMEWPVLTQPVLLTPNDPSKWTNFDASKTVQVSIYPPECRQTAKDTVGGYLYAAQFNTLPVRSLRRYVPSGSGYSEDLGWIAEAGPSVDGVSISCADPSVLFIGRDQIGGTNLERWYIEHPSPEIDGPALLDAYRVANRMVHNVASDSRGNVLFDADGASRTLRQTWLGMFVFPDNGSEDTRTAGPFMHEGSGQGQEKPYIRDVTLLPPGSVVSLRGKVVSACFGNVVYVQEPDRAAGIRAELASSSALSPGTVVSVTGTVDRSLGENRLVNAQVEVTGSGESPRPLAMRTSNVNNDPSEQLRFTGVNNVGLLTRVSGVVTRVDTQNALFYVDDGCGLDNGFGCVGVAVSFDDMTPPLVGDRVAVTAVSSCRGIPLATDRIINGIPVSTGTTVYEPTLLLRDQQDVCFL